MVRVFVISSVSGTRKFSKQYSKSMSRMYCVQRGLCATSIRSGRKSTKFWNGTKWQGSHTTFTRLAVNTVIRGVTVHRGCCTILGDEGGGGKVREAAWTTEAIGVVQAGVCVELKTESLVISLVPSNGQFTPLLHKSPSLSGGDAVCIVIATPSPTAMDQQSEVHLEAS